MRFLVVGGLSIITAASVWMILRLSRARTELEAAFASQETGEIMPSLHAATSLMDMPKEVTILYAIGFTALISGLIMYLRKRFPGGKLNANTAAPG